MRPFEILFVMLAAAAAAFLIGGRWRISGRLFLGAALGTVLAHVIFEGVHWQLIPAYAAVGVLSLIALSASGGARRRRIAAGTSVLLLMAAGVAFSMILPMFRLPRPTGPYAVGTTILYLKDTSRVDDAAPTPGAPRELMVQIWYPAEHSSNPLAHYRERSETDRISSYQSEIRTHARLDAPVSGAGAAFPVILFNHGWGNRRTSDTFLTEELASHGYVVASIDHPYNAGRVAFPDGRVAYGNMGAVLDISHQTTGDSMIVAWNKELQKWAADQRFVLDHLAAMDKTSGTMWFGRMNTDMAGAMGHSFGGAAATEMCALDPRIHGAINMDGWFFGAIHARGANQPLLFMNAVPVDANPAHPLPTAIEPGMTLDAQLDATDLADVEASMQKYGGYLLWVKGVHHEDYTDQALFSPLRRIANRGVVPAAQIQPILRAYVLAFFDKTIRGENPELLRSQPGPYSQTMLNIWPRETNPGAAAAAGQ